VLRGLRRRLDRLWAGYRREAEASDAERDVLDVRAKVAAAIRAGLAYNGIDPDSVPALRRLEQPEPASRAMSVAPPGPLELFRDRMRTLARRCREYPPKLADATPAELFAVFCFGDDVT